MPSLIEPDLIQNPQGVAFSRSTARFQVAVAGRRSGKTLRAKRKLAAHALRYPGRYAACAPTRDQAKKLFWQDLKTMCRGVMAGDPSETELTIRTVTGSEIVVVGLDKPQRIEGSPWHGLLLDEFDDVKPDAWDANLRPALSDTLGFAWFIGVPEGYKQLYQFWKLGQDGEPDWESFLWPSSDVIPQEELDAARRTMDPRLYRQEYEASFEAPSGRVYDDFARDQNVRPCPFDRALPIVVGMDFNINPMSAVIYQRHGQEWWVPPGGTIELPNSSTRRMAEALKSWGDARYRPHDPNWMRDAIIACDPAGAARQHNFGTSSVDLLRASGFQVVFRRVDYEADKYNALRALVLNAAGVRRLFVDPDNKRLIQRMESLEYDDEDDHLTDAAAYPAHWAREAYRREVA